MKDGWQIKTLGDVCHVYQPETISQKQMAGGEFPVYGANGQIGWHNQFNHDESQLILGCRGSCGSVHFTKPRAWINGNAMVVQPKPGAIDPCYLAYALKGGIELADAITGTAQPQITRKSLMPLAITLPKNIAEQQRIVTLLDEAFADIATAKANAERNLQSARELFESHLESIFRHQGEHWERLTLEMLLDRKWIEGHMDGNHGSDYPRKEEFVEEGVPYISANCLDDKCKIDMARAKYLTPERASLLRKGISKNRDVLFAHNATVGPVAILRTEEENVVLSTSLTYYRCNPRHILPEYLAHYMRSDSFSNQYSLVMKQSTRNQVPITKQREFFHIIPPLEDQEQITDSLDGLLESTQHLAHLYERKLAALEELKTSLLHQAFNGEL